MDSVLSGSLNGLISGLAFVCPNNNVASSWILNNIPSDNILEAFMIIKSHLYNTNDVKHVINILNIITQLGNHKEYITIIKQHSHNIITHLLNSIKDSNFSKSIRNIANLWVKSGLLDWENIEINDNSQFHIVQFEDDLTAGDIANLINEFKLSGNWVPYMPMDYNKKSDIKIDNKDIVNIVNQCIEELNSICTT